MLEGFHSLKTSAEKSVSALQLYQAALKNPHLGNLVLKLVNAGFKAHAVWQLVASGISSRSKLVNELHCRKALTKVVAVGNGVLNEVSPLELHALVKFTLVASVPSFAPPLKSVSAEQSLHASWKFVPFLASIAPNELNEVASCHEELNELPELKSIEPNEVKALCLQVF